jgi:hypothetical protein
MKLTSSVLWLLSVPVILTLPSSRVFAEDGAPTGTVTVNTQTDGKTTLEFKSTDWQTLLDEVFGTPIDDGLLDGTRAFQIRAQDLILTSDQALFFTDIDSPDSLSALIDAAIDRRGMIRMDGTIDGEPFELKLAGRELKIEGLTLTEEQRQALIAELSGISGLKEMKIQALVDGRMTVTKFQGGHEKLEIRNERGRPEQERGRRLTESNVRTESTHANASNARHASKNPKDQNAGHRAGADAPCPAASGTIRRLKRLCGLGPATTDSSPYVFPDGNWLRQGRLRHA